MIEAVVRNHFSNSVLTNLANFTVKTPVLESLFNKVVGLQPTTFLKHRCFTMNFGKFKKKSFS